MSNKSPSWPNLLVFNILNVQISHMCLFYFSWQREGNLCVPFFPPSSLAHSEDDGNESKEMGDIRRKTKAKKSPHCGIYRSMSAPWRYPPASSCCLLATHEIILVRLSMNRLFHDDLRLLKCLGIILLILGLVGIVSLSSRAVNVWTRAHAHA